jgi:hypothetical protein
VKALKIIILTVPLSLFLWYSSSEEEAIEVLKVLECSDVFNEKYIEISFSESKIIPLSPYRKASNTAKSCGYTFSVGDIHYDSSLTLDVLGDATELIFEASVKEFKEKKFLMGVGERAYIYPLGLAYQMTVLSKGNLVHGYIIEDDKQTLTFDRKMSKKLLLDVLEHLDLS